MARLNSIRWPWLITLLVTIAYLPFLDLRVLRMAGDEKVYLSQAIEMARDGRWFVQTLADQPDYYKGPLHYILIRAGLFVFGDHIIAGIYMNWLLALIAGLALWRMGRRGGWREDRAGLLGLAAALNVGIWTHGLASQMETELMALYGLAGAALGIEALTEKTKAKSGRGDLPFWVLAGIAGWLKSPLHAALLGSGAVLFWFSIGQLGRRLRSPGPWLSVLCGVAVCALGYGPAYFLDRQNFVDIFLGRENVGKPDNGRHIDYVLRSLPHFLFPWVAVTLGGLGILVVRWVQRWKGFGALLGQNLSRAPALVLSADETLARLGVAAALPTIIFFCAFPYKGQNYNLPALSLLLIAAWAAFPGGVPRWSHRVAGVLNAAVFLAVCAVCARFFLPTGVPEWWHWSWLVLALGASAVAAALFLTCETARGAALAAMLFFVGFGALITPLGEREMAGVRRFVRDRPDVALHYYNLEPTIWSEWGLLQLVLHRPVQGVHQEKQLAAALAPGHALLVPGAEALGQLQAHAKAAGISLDGIHQQAWTRWMTKGKNAQGQTLWGVAWRQGKLTVLEREFYILWR